MDAVSLSAKEKLPIFMLRCRICSHVWVPRKAKSPDQCPKCRSRLWYRLKKTRDRGEPHDE